MTRFDAVVVGAGFAGLSILRELREQGLSVHVVERGSDVGGTWYWNRYPGARTDSESWVYAYSFSQELQDEWDWTERFPTQPETLSYLRYVADRFDLRKDIEFNTRVTAAHYDEQANEWSVTTDQGETHTCAYFVPACGPLSVPYRPDFPGLDDYTGDWHQTGNWPKDGVDFAGKKVICIGTGATAVQLIPIVAKTAAELTVFQRTPNYVLPARNYVLTDDERQEIRANYDAIWAQAREHFFAFPMSPTGQFATQVSEEERQKVLERGWEIGGFRYIFETFDDIIVDYKANEYAAEFVRNKIRAVVNDPETAELLCPTDYPIAGKRPPLGHFYYETFNRDNVRLVDARTHPIEAITATGLRTTAAEYDADIIIFATGFDAVTGSLSGIDIRGRDGAALTDRWTGGPRTHLGIGVDGFPNMFLIGGPQTPFANLPVVIEGITSYVGRAISHLREHDLAAAEATPDAVEQWRKHMDDLLNATVLPRGRNSWFLGDNIPGKPHVVLFHFGGAGRYRQECEASADAGFEGFAFTAAPAARA